MYGKPIAKVVAPVAEKESGDSESEVKSVAAMKKGRESVRKKKHWFTRSGQPICDKCHKIGHIAKECPKRIRFGKNGYKGNNMLVYTLQK